MTIKKICVFCGHAAGKNPEYLDAAKELGRALAKNKIELVYGGGATGIMGALADAVLGNGGRAVGVVPREVFGESSLHPKLDDLKIVSSMHERKEMMSELADAFIIMPGGIGTLEEFFECWTWNQLGIHKKPLGLLNTSSHYDLLLQFTEHLIYHEFLAETDQDLLIVEESAPALLKKLKI